VTEDVTLSSWQEVVDAIDYLAHRPWAFRGQENSGWSLQTSLEREFGIHAQTVEDTLFWHFVRRAPHLLQGPIPQESDTAAWLGLIQHYGGPTRLLDVTRSPFVALFFAFEPSGPAERALWALDYAWCFTECGAIMARNEGRPANEMVERTLAGQAYLVDCLIHRRPLAIGSFDSFRPFRGVFLVDPWKPDPRQLAQQAMFMCSADLSVGFADNLAAHSTPATPTVCRFRIPGGLREEILGRLALMNVSAATLFPDLVGLARSLRTVAIPNAIFARFRTAGSVAPPPWRRTRP
jgi:hypothetical protein